MMKTLLIAGASAALASLSVIAAPAIAAEAATEATPETTQAASQSGTWAKVTSNTKGTWTIYSEGDKTFVALSDDFKTRGAPDLKLFLSPKAAGDLNGRNATDGAVLISKLASNRGAQVYELPAGVDLASYATLIIHCEQFAKLWSTAAL